MGKYLLFEAFFILNFLIGCTSDEQEAGQAKNVCYNHQLDKLMFQPVYNQVMSQFRDTFEVMKSDIRYFGSPGVVVNKIDKAVFFNKNKTECLLIVLQINNLGLVFGDARIVRGESVDKKWRFKPSIVYSYDKDYLNIYPENSFEKLSVLARQSVLTDGEVPRRGCQIDEDYWFVQLKN